MRFEGKTAVITAAGAGIGRATSDIFGEGGRDRRRGRNRSGQDR